MEVRKMGWMGVNQSPSWEETVEVVKKYVDEGRQVEVRPQKFHGPGTQEHPYPLEYEVYVYFDD